MQKIYIFNIYLIYVNLVNANESNLKNKVFL